MSPLPPSFHFIYNLATLLLGCKHLFNVIIFLVFRSMSWSSSFVQPKIPALYLITPIAQTFKPEMKFPAFRFDRQINSTLLMYSLPMFSCISLFMVLSSWSTPRYLYPSWSTSFILSPSSNSIPSLLTSLPLYSSSTAHLSIPNFIPMSSE